MHRSSYPRRYLSGAPAGDQNADCLDGDEHIQPKGKVFDVVEIVLDLDPGFIRAGRIALGDLGPAGNTGPNNMPINIKRNFLVELLYKKTLLRPGADPAHIPFQDIP